MSVETVAVAKPGRLLADLLDWCARHPFDGDEQTPGDVQFVQSYDATLHALTAFLVGEAPNILAITTAMLDEVSPEAMVFERGLLRINIQPSQLLYEPLYVGRAAESMVFRYVCPRCHNTRKVPDWKNWNHEYGEPRPKRCPECVEA